VPSVDGFHESILEKAHILRYSIHPSVTKMYKDLSQHYWWRRMKKDIIEYVARCLSCQQVKYEHQRWGYLLQRLEIPEWKWDLITKDFVVGLPQTLKKFDAVWVIVDRLTKSAQFIPVVTTYSSEQLAQIYIREIVRLHGVPVYIISDRGTLFTLYFWRAVQCELGTQVKLSRTFQSPDGLAVRVHHFDLGGYAMCMCYGFTQIGWPRRAPCALLNRLPA